MQISIQVHTDRSMHLWYKLLKTNTKNCTYRRVYQKVHVVFVALLEIICMLKMNIITIYYTFTSFLYNWYLVNNITSSKSEIFKQFIISHTQPHFRSYLCQIWWWYTSIITGDYCCFRHAINPEMTACTVKALSAVRETCCKFSIYHFSFIFGSILWHHLLGLKSY